VALEAVHHAGVRLHLAGEDAGVGSLVLDGELDLLDGSRDGLGHGAGDTTGGEVDKNASLVVLSHGGLK